MLRPELAHLAGVERRRIEMPKDVWMRLNRLERPEPCPIPLAFEMHEALDLSRIQQYPDYPPFYRRLAEFIGVPADRIVIGAGIEEFIRILFAGAFGRHVVTLWPTCAMIDVYARSFRVHLDRVLTDPERPPTIDQIIGRIGSDTALVFLPNPGQPVETCYGLDELRRLAAWCVQVGAVLAIDEAYHGFGAPDATELAWEFDNVVVLRTFSKAMGAAGIRLGYAIAGERMTAVLNAVRQSGEVSSLSMAVATALMEHFEACVRPGIEDIIAGRDMLVRMLRERGLPAWGRWANHVLIELPDAAGVASRLADRGVLVRLTAQAPVDRHILVSCGSPQLMRAFHAELRAAL